MKKNDEEDRSLPSSITIIRPQIPEDLAKKGQSSNWNELEVYNLMRKYDYYIDNSD
jgi:hypothetical protein